MTTLNKKLIASNLEQDNIDSCFNNFVHMHPGDIKAESETIENVTLFADEENKLTLEDGLIGYSSIWFRDLYKLQRKL